MMIILYGNWVAMSVVEEKSSRVMEVILNAATPFQLLTGKVLGVGAVALMQYAASCWPAALALLLQGPIATRCPRRAAAGVALPAGLTVGLLVLFGVYGVLGFLLYAVLYAAAGSLVSRQEDVNSVGHADDAAGDGGLPGRGLRGDGPARLRSGWVGGMAQVPFFSPFMMLSRIAAARHAAWEVVLSIATAGRDDRRRAVAGRPDLRRRRPAVRPAAGLPIVVHLVREGM